MATYIEQCYEEHIKSIDRYGNYTNIEIPFLVFEVEDEDAALRAVLAEVEQELEGLPLSEIEIDERRTEDTFKVVATYKNQTSTTTSIGGGDDDEQSTVSFDCGGGSKHLTHSISQRKAFGTKEAGGAIGWNGKTGSEMSITGVDVPVAQLRETYTKTMRLSKITTSYKRTVAGLVGKVNSAQFKGWSPGEVMFLGMSYSAPDKSSTKVTITYNFSIQLNESSAKIGDKSIGDKKGFEYVWALSETVVGENDVPKAEISAIYVDQVCDYASFSALGL